MISLKTYGAISILVTCSCIWWAFHSQEQFYPAVVYLVSFKPNVVVLGNFMFFCAILLGKVLQIVFLGKLSTLEVQAVKDNARLAIMDSCLALTIFRDDLGLSTFFLFSLLFFFKVFHWIVLPRVESVGWSQNMTITSHVRLTALIGFLYFVDFTSLVTFTFYLLQRSTPNVLLLFAFEYSILAVTMGRISLMYLVAVLDARIEGDWERKSVYLFYIDLTSDAIRLVLYSSFFFVVCFFFGLPIHLFRELYSTFHSLRTRLMRYLRYKRLVESLNNRFPYANEEELEDADHSCIICREEMLSAKKLPCKHIFHLHCLRSWMERSNNCPICRAVIPTEAATAQRENMQMPRNFGFDRDQPAVEEVDAQPRDRTGEEKVDDLPPQTDADNGQLRLLQENALLIQKQMQMHQEILRKLHEQYLDVIELQKRYISNQSGHVHQE